MTTDLVSSWDVIDAASEAGVHCTHATIAHAVFHGQLTPATERPRRFTRAEANRWLTAMWQQGGAL